jgi:hypothetical protein
MTDVPPVMALAASMALALPLCVTLVRRSIGGCRKRDGRYRPGTDPGITLSGVRRFLATLLSV